MIKREVTEQINAALNNNESIKQEVTKQTSSAILEAKKDYLNLTSEVRILHLKVQKHDERIEESDRKHHLDTLIVTGIDRNHDVPLKTDIATQLSKATEEAFSAFDIAEPFPIGPGGSNRSYQVRFKDINLEGDHEAQRPPKADENIR